MLDSSPNLADEAAKRLSDGYKNWSERNKILRRKVEIAAILAGLLFASFQAWQDEQSKFDFAEKQRISSQEWLAKWKVRADDRWHSINDKGGYLDQIKQLSDQKLKKPQSAERPNLRRLIAYQAPDIVLGTDQKGGITITGYSMPTVNVSGDTISIELALIRVSVDAAMIMEAKNSQKGILPQTQTMPYQLRRSNGPVPITPDTKLVTAEFEIDYDTIPATGIRRSYRKINYPLVWANGPNNNPLHEGSVVDQWEK